MVVFSGFLLGAKVQLSTAEMVARSIHLEHAGLHNGNEFMVSNVETIKNEESNLIYIFHLEPKGFIMVPADDQAVPNLAFGFDHSFESSNMPLNLNALINQYKNELMALINNPKEPPKEIAEKWDYYLSGNIEPSRERDDKYCRNHRENEQCSCGWLFSDVSNTFGETTHE